MSWETEASAYRSKAKRLCGIACSLRTKNEIRDDDLARIQSEAAALEARADDPRLYLGIVGESSTGKSTFINALLGFELLKESALLETTCAPTLLSKGNDFTITVNFWNGKPWVCHPASNASRRFRMCVGVEHVLECIEKASEFINKYTAEEDVSKTVADVRIEIPGDYWHLPDNIVVVDTPGLNTDNPRHGMVTCAAVRNLCDLCCVLTSATAPLPDTLVRFVSENLREMQGRCVYVATQLDRVPRHDREGQVNYISDRLASEGLSFGKVFGVSSIFAAHPDEHHAEAESFRAGFSDFVEALSSMLEDARNDVICEKTERLVKHLADETLRPMIESMRDKFRRWKNAIASSRLPDPDLFFKEKRRDALAILQREGDRADQENRSLLDHAVDDLHDEVAQKICNARRLDDIKSVLSTLPSQRLNSTMREALQGYANRCADSVQKILGQIKSEFNSAYRNLSLNVPDSASGAVASNSGISFELPQMSFACTVDAVDSLVWLGHFRIRPALIFAIFIGCKSVYEFGRHLYSIFRKDIAEYRQVENNPLLIDVKELRQKVSNYFEEQRQAIFSQIVSEVDGQLDCYRKQSPIIRAAIEKEEAELDRIDRIIADANEDLRTLTPFINPSQPQ